MAVATTTKTFKAAVLKRVQRSGKTGKTVAELRGLFPDRHHGTISSTLSGLHDQGELVRLERRRGGCHIYVTPGNEGGRTPDERNQITDFEYAVMNLEGAVVYRGAEEPARRISTKGRNLRLLRRKTHPWEIIK